MRKKLQKKIAGKRKGDKLTDLSRKKTDQLIEFYVLGGPKSKSVFASKSLSL